MWSSLGLDSLGGLSLIVGCERGASDGVSTLAPLLWLNLTHGVSISPASSFSA